MELIKDLETRKTKYGKWKRYGIFLCGHCKKEVERRIDSGKRQKSCGCNLSNLCKERFSKHNECNTRIYRIWNNMKNRCLCENNKDYKDYGNRGIKVCNEWLEFIPFRIWALSNGYEKELSIDRINNNGNYEPDNCKFSTALEQAKNKRRSSTTKLNWLTVRIIRALYLDGYTVKMLFEIFDMTLGNLWNIVNNKTWKEEVV